MIRLIRPEDEILIKKIIEKDIYQNVYIYIDINTYGFISEAIKTYILQVEDNIKAILYHYYNSLQIFICGKLNFYELSCVAEHIKKYNFKIISGNKKIIKDLYNQLNLSYRINNGYVMKKEKLVKSSSGITEIAKADDYEQIAELVCEDKSIGGHYSIPQLIKQFNERKENYNCKNLIIKNNNKVICHMGVYANSPKIAVLGGLITEKKYRGLGYGMKILNDLTQLVQIENKVPILYCYNKKIINWYKKLGWECLTESYKLEKKD